MHGGVKFYRGSAKAARAYVEADHARADDYYLAEGSGLATRYVATNTAVKSTKPQQALVFGVIPDRASLLANRRLQEASDPSELENHARNDARERQRAGDHGQQHWE